jgi:hypothetical protein
MENPHIRAFSSMQENDSGVMVIHTLPLSGADMALKKDDVLMAIEVRSPVSISFRTPNTSETRVRLCRAVCVCVCVCRVCILAMTEAFPFENVYAFFSSVDCGRECDG